MTDHLEAAGLDPERGPQSQGRGLSLDQFDSDMVPAGAFRAFNDQSLLIAAVRRYIRLQRRSLRVLGVQHAVLVEEPVSETKRFAVRIQ